MNHQHFRLYAYTWVIFAAEDVRGRQGRLSLRYPKPNRAAAALQATSPPPLSASHVCRCQRWPGSVRESVCAQVQAPHFFSSSSLHSLKALQCKLSFFWLMIHIKSAITFPMYWQNCGHRAFEGLLMPEEKAMPLWFKIGRMHASSSSLKLADLVYARRRSGTEPMYCCYCLLCCH